MKKLIRSVLSNRILVGGVLMLAQLVIVLSLLLQITELNIIFYYLFFVISLLMVLWLVNKDDNPAYKISWIILIFTFPLFGGVFYLIWGNTPFNRSKLVKLKSIDRELFKTSELIVVTSDLNNLNPQFPRLANYVENFGNFPVYQNSGCEFFKIGEEFFESLVENLQKAQSFIFMEYFIVEEGVMWSKILDILIEKAKQGVEVRFMYDDAGCLSTLPARYDKTLNQYGIKCVRFNPFRPTLHTYLNYRDHRKICVIDGEIGFMGGINLADEYINEVERFGHWKDTAILMSGESVSSLTIMFLELWNFACDIIEADYSKYLSEKKQQTQGFIQPFSDSPLDNFNIGENVYMQIINSARDYVYITSPYLILDNEMITSLCVAAQSGIDVRIITPFVPDKKYVHPVTRSFYAQLIASGVKVYEYTPGFMHGKMIISDDEIAVVGTINLDFRSFYMHFECGTILYDCPIIRDIKEDFISTFEISKFITTNDLDNRVVRFISSILRLFSPIM